MNQRETVLAMLRDAGDRGVTSNEFFASMLPRFSARIHELRNEGHRIEKEPVEQGHFCYRLTDFRGTIDGHDVTAPDPRSSHRGTTPGAGGSSPFSSPPSAPVSHSSADSCRTPGGKGAGGSLLVETSPLQLFESPDAAYVDADQRVA